MRSTQNIIEEYRKAGLEKRLDLFLESPSLRTRFAEIDQNEIAGPSSGEERRGQDMAVNESKHSYGQE